MRLLFVCVENSCRSQMAEALARLRGADAFSAGSNPSGVVHPGAIATMRELGVDMSGHRSKSILEFEGTPFDVAVTMGCGDPCPAMVATRQVDWAIPDPKGMDAAGFRDIRDSMASRIETLLAG